ncbi:hypothetical protein DFH27DRAFT_525460 [Peziza echinospora]|nr:hypothetical protein DFH27DRAFT_525460 [Peziza echinospora]
MSTCCEMPFKPQHRTLSRTSKVSAAPASRSAPHQHIIDILPPGGLNTLTSTLLSATIHSLRDAEHARVATDVSWEEFRKWQTDVAGDVFCDDYGPRELIALRKLVRFRVRDRGGETPLGDVIVQCRPTPYHDAVFQCVQREIERAVNRVLAGRGEGGRGPDSGLSYETSPEILGLLASPAYPTIAPTMTRMPDGAIYAPLTASLNPLHSTFPTVVFEVGFCESAEDLVHDAAVLLHGTGEALRDLTPWSLAMDALGHLSPPLVGPLDGHLYVYRHPCTATTTSNAPAPKTATHLSPPLHDAGTGIECTFSTPFIRADAPIPGARFSLLLGDLFGASTDIEGSGGGDEGEKEKVEFDLAWVAEYVLSKRERMRQRRALQRAEAAQTKIINEAQGDGSRNAPVDCLATDPWLGMRLKRPRM